MSPPRCACSGSATTTLTLPRRLTAQQQRATHEDVRRQIDTLREEYTDAQAAHMLNERGLRTGAGDPFDSKSIHWVRFAHKLESLKQRLLENGWQAAKQIACTLGVKRTTLGRWRRQGRIQARICNDRGEWLHRMPEERPASGKNITPSPMDNPTARGGV